VYCKVSCSVLQNVLQVIWIHRKFSALQKVRVISFFFSLLYSCRSMTLFTENATSSKSTKSRNSCSSVHIEIKPKSQFEFVQRDTKQSEFLDVVDFGGVAFSVEIVIRPPRKEQVLANADVDLDVDADVDLDVRPHRL